MKCAKCGEELEEKRTKIVAEVKGNYDKVVRYDFSICQDCMGIFKIWLGVY